MKQEPQAVQLSEQGQNPLGTSRYSAEAISKQLGVSSATIRNRWLRYLAAAVPMNRLRVQVGTDKAGQPRYEFTALALELFTDYKAKVSNGDMASDQWVADVKASQPVEVEVEIGGTAITPYVPNIKGMSTYAHSIRTQSQQFEEKVIDVVWDVATQAQDLRMQELEAIAAEAEAEALAEFELKERIKAAKLAQLQREKMEAKKAGNVA